MATDQNTAASSLAQDVAQIANVYSAVATLAGLSNDQIKNNLSNVSQMTDNAANYNDSKQTSNYTDADRAAWQVNKTTPTYAGSAGFSPAQNRSAADNTLYQLYNAQLSDKNAYKYFGTQAGISQSNINQGLGIANAANGYNTFPNTSAAVASATPTTTSVNPGSNAPLSANSSNAPTTNTSTYTSSFAGGTITTTVNNLPSGTTILPNSNGTYNAIGTPSMSSAPTSTAPTSVTPFSSGSDVFANLSDAIKYGGLSRSGATTAQSSSSGFTLPTSGFNPYDPSAPLTNPNGQSFADSDAYYKAMAGNTQPNSNDPSVANSIVAADLQSRGINPYLIMGDKAPGYDSYLASGGTPYSGSGFMNSSAADSASSNSSNSAPDSGSDAGSDSSNASDASSDSGSNGSSAATSRVIRDGSIVSATSLNAPSADVSGAVQFDMNRMFQDNPTADKQSNEKSVKSADKASKGVKGAKSPISAKKSHVVGKNNEAYTKGATDGKNVPLYANDIKVRKVKGKNGKTEYKFDVSAKTRADLDSSARSGRYLNNSGGKGSHAQTFSRSDFNKIMKANGYGKLTDAQLNKLAASGKPLANGKDNIAFNANVKKGTNGKNTIDSKSIKPASKSFNYNKERSIEKAKVNKQAHPYAANHTQAKANKKAVAKPKPKAAPKRHVSHKSYGPGR